MDREEAAAVAEGVIARLRATSYDSLVARLLGEIEVEEIVGASGVTYQAEIQAMWDAGKPPALLVMVGVDDGGFRSSFSPVSRSFITTGHGTFIGE
ncbi:MAG TPA: hypothetical protein VFH90_04420 [Candidatus Limnocylindria bacterium]|nr:hypothetical protein [Candidatus Limnocylindria bacterium]